VIGNLVYKVNTTMEYINGTQEEAYLNTFIQASQWGGFGVDTSDFQCNAWIDTGKRFESAGSGTQVDNNVFYGVTSYSTGTNNVNKTISTRANSTNYSTGAIIRPATLNNYLYRATTTGTTAGSQPTWCTDLGCTVVDGGVTWQAVRGPYTFYRKLRTAPELYTIPYARVHSSAPEVGFCPSGYASRKGIGIGD
jgi:hypothetical protein